MTLPADELRSLAAGARKAAEHYREHPNEIMRTVVVDLYSMIARLAEQLARPVVTSPGAELPYWRGRRPPPPDDPPPMAA
jgi:hypothetical protein